VGQGPSALPNTGGSPVGPQGLHPWIAAVIAGMTMLAGSASIALVTARACNEQ
jgi:hypothetical protein